MIKWLKNKFKKSPQPVEKILRQHFNDNPIPEGFDTKSKEASLGVDDDEPKVHIVPSYYNEDGSVNENFQGSND